MFSHFQGLGDASLPTADFPGTVTYPDSGALNVLTPEELAALGPSPSPDPNAGAGAYSTFFTQPRASGAAGVSTGQAGPGPVTTQQAYAIAQRAAQISAGAPRVAGVRSSSSSMYLIGAAIVIGVLLLSKK